MEDSYVTFIEHYNWCNYPFNTKSSTKHKINYKYCAINEDAKSIVSNKSFVNKKRSIGSGPCKIKSEPPENEFNLHFQKRDSRVVFPNESVVSPWLKFGLEKDPWEESMLKKLIQLECDEGDVGGPLSNQIIASGISNLVQMPDTKAYAVTKLQVSKRGLTDIKSLIAFRCFQYIDISWNEISDLTPLDNMVYLMCLNASHNKIKDALEMKAPWYLTYVSLACNEITVIGDLSEFWSLRYINLSYNRISKIEGFQNLKYLKYLNLSHNFITYVENLGDIDLEDLELQYNKISSGEMNSHGLINLSSAIKFLNLSHNRLNSLKLFEDLGLLKEFFISHNLISAIEELDYLKNMKHITSFSLDENAVSSFELYKSIVLYYLPQLEIFDGVNVTEEEREATQLLFSPEVLKQQCRLHTKLLVFEQLASPPITMDAQPCEGVAFPLLVLVGPYGTRKTRLLKQLVDEFGDYVYPANNHISATGLGVTLKFNTFPEYYISEELFHEMIVEGKFLATSEMAGIRFGFSKEEFANSIECGKLCIVWADLIMAFSLKALGLKPYLILVMTNDSDLHRANIAHNFNIQKDSLLSFSHEEAGSFRDITQEISGGCIEGSLVGLENNFIVEGLSETTCPFSGNVCSKCDVQPHDNSINELPSVKDKTLVVSKNHIHLNAHEDADQIDRTEVYVDELNYQLEEAPGSLHYTESIGFEPSDVQASIDSQYTFYEANATKDSLSKESEFFSESPFSSSHKEKKVSVNESIMSEEHSSEDILSQTCKLSALSGRHLKRIDATSGKFYKGLSRELQSDSQLTTDSYNVASPIGPIMSAKSFASKFSDRSRQSYMDRLANERLDITCKDESSYNWSWTSSDESEEEEAEEPEIICEKPKSSSSMASKAITFITKQVLDSRQAYLDLIESGFYKDVIFTDNYDSAYESFKKIAYQFYNNKPDMEFLHSIKQDPLYQTVFNQKMTELMEVMDKTESTAALKRD